MLYAAKIKDIWRYLLPLMHIAYLLIGGNCGDREEYLKKAREKIGSQCGDLLAASAIFETAAWGVKDQSSFYNQALKVTVSISAKETLEIILNIEKSLGRIRNERYGPRTIDIDIIFFDNEIITLPQLTIPHPQLQNRRFALECINEIAPQFIHPVLKKTVEQLLFECLDLLEVRKLPPENTESSIIKKAPTVLKSSNEAIKKED